MIFNAFNILLISDKLSFLGVSWHIYIKYIHVHTRAYDSVIYKAVKPLIEKIEKDLTSI